MKPAVIKQLIRLSISYLSRRAESTENYGLGGGSQGCGVIAVSRKWPRRMRAIPRAEAGPWGGRSVPQPRYNVQPTDANLGHRAGHLENILEAYGRDRCHASRGQSRRPQHD